MLVPLPSNKLSKFYKNAKQTKLINNTSLFILLAAQPCKLVGNNNIKLCCSFHYLFSLLSGNIVGDLSTIGPDK